MPTRRARSSLPQKLPNPPPTFVGRTREIAWLRRAIARAPVTVIAGEGGLGKSALALFVLHARFPERAGSVLALSLRDLDPHEPVALGFLRALVRAGSVTDFQWAELLASPEALGNAAVELAEAQRRWILLEDLHHGDPAQVDALVGHAARYARESRFVITTRRVPDDEALLGQVLHLGAMSERDLARLARAIDPAADREAIRAAVAQAAGSPWKLRRARASSSPARRSSRPPAASGEVLEVLRLFEIPLPEAALARIVPLPPGDLDALERQGLIERRSHGVRLHEIAEAVVPAPAPPRQRSIGARAAEVLAQSADLDAQLTALRLLVEAGASDAAAALLDASAPSLIEAGYAPALFRLLEGSAEARLARVRLRCAVELGDAEVLARVSPPGDADPETRLLWARALLTKGQLADAAREADAVHAHAVAAGALDLALSAGLLAAQAVGNHEGLDAGLARLDRLDRLSSNDPAGAALLQAYRAYTLAAQGRTEESLAAAAIASQGLARIAWPARGTAGSMLARALYRLGRVREASALFDAAIADPRTGSARFDVGRTSRVIRAALAHDSGDLARARAELDALEPYVGASSLLAHYACSLRITVAISAGDLAGIDARFGPSSGVPDSVERERGLDRVRLAILRREPIPASHRDPSTSLIGDAHRMHLVEHGLRAGTLAPDDALRALDRRFEQAELRSMLTRIRAVAHLVAGRAEEALAELAASIADARDHGFRVAEAESREIAGDALLLAGRASGIPAEAAALRAFAGSMPSPRFACAALFLETIAAGPLDPAALESLAGAWLAAPHFALRARALLGAPVPPDALDRLVLAALIHLREWQSPALLDPPPPGASTWQPGWGVDQRTRTVWLPSGARVDFSRHRVSWKILGALVAAGGRASKEDLVAAVWDERDYHPLRHDNRLQVAVRALRALVEEDPKRPSRVLTTADGYALGGGARAIRAVSQAS